MRILLIALAVAAGVWLAAIVGLLIAGRRTHARELATLLPNLVRLFRGLMKDDRVPRRTKWLLGFGALWFASPIDLVPEFIPVLGPLDDLVVAALILRHVIRVAGPEILHAHWHGEPATLDAILRVARTPRPSRGEGPPRAASSG